MRENFKTFLLIAIIIQLYRTFVLLNAQIDLYVDEAYYWGWSQEFSFGYYSKPPMIAWVIALFTSICGDSEFCIKLPSIILYLVSAIFIYLNAKELFNEKVAFYSGLVFITLPAVSLSSLIISTDVVLLLFWSMALYFFIKALQNDRWIYWIAAGVSAGFGLLSKYTMIIFLFSVFIYFFIDRRNQLKNPKLYTAIIIAALIYFPNLIWNANHHFISFLHTKEISHISDISHFHFDKLLEFILAQFGVFGPIFFAVFLYLLFKPIKQKPFKILYSFSLPFFAIISLQAFLSRAFANWAAPTYIAATILVTGYLILKNRKKLLFSGIAVNILLALLLYNYHSIAKFFNIELTSKTDPFKRVKGFKELAHELKPFLKEYPNKKFLFDSRTTMAEMIYYLRPYLFNSLMYNPSKKLKSQYHLFTDLNRHIGEDFIYVTQSTKSDFKKYFKNTELLKTIKIPLYKDYSRTYYVYLVKEFKGY